MLSHCEWLKAELVGPSSVRKYTEKQCAIDLPTELEKIRAYASCKERVHRVGSCQ